MKWGVIINIIFDIGMVLADFRWSGYCKDKGISEAVVKLLEERMILNPVWDEFDLALIPPEILIDKLEGRFPECKAEYRKFWEDITELVLPFDYSADWIKRLKAQGHRVYLLSNYPGFMFEVHSKSFGFMDDIDGRVVSYEYHIMKPDPMIYNILLKKYDLKAEECVFLDDRKVNTDGAEKCGIHGIWFKDYQSASAELDAYINSRKD